MFVHLGGTTVVQAEDIVAILGVNIESSSPDNALLLTKAKENRAVDVIEAEETKSIVVTTERIYYSPVSPPTLKRRSHVTTT